MDLIFYLRLSTARTERIQTQQHRPTCLCISKNMSCILCCWPSSAPFCYAPVSLLLFFHVILLPGFVCIWSCFAEIAPSALSKNKTPKLSQAGEGKSIACHWFLFLVPLSATSQSLYSTTLPCVFAVLYPLILLFVFSCFTFSEVLDKLHILVSCFLHGRQDCML